MLIDRARIEVRSGKGGDGHVSFRREKFINKGGPNGGDGGNGGSVILQAEPGVDTLLDFTGRRHWFAEAGEAGRAKQQHGAAGKDLVILVPPGTLVYDDETGELIGDLDEPYKQMVVCQGGRGGFGNEHFKSATNQTPRNFSPGEPGEERKLRFELKLIADVGLVGKPNAGKSTLLSRVSKARPKIADYPFTTLEPNLGIAELPGAAGHARRLVMADIPGLIEGAHEGHGLGMDFLRHIERTRVLVHLLEIHPSDGSDPIENYRVIQNELSSYSPALAQKPVILAASKMDLLTSNEDQQTALELLEEGIGQKILPISSASGAGLTELLETCWKHLEPFKTPAPREGWSVEPLSSDE